MPGHLLRHHLGADVCFSASSSGSLAPAVPILASTAATRWTRRATSCSASGETWMVPAGAPVRHLLHSALRDQDEGGEEDRLHRGHHGRDHEGGTEAREPRPPQAVIQAPKSTRWMEPP